MQGMQCDLAHYLWPPELKPPGVSCFRNWRRCLPWIVPHHTRQRARGNLKSSSASGQTHSWLHDLQFTWTIPSFWNDFSVRRKKWYFSLWSVSIYFSATWTFSGGFLVSGRARNIISTDNNKVRSWGAQEELYGVFTKGGQKDDISMYRNAAVTSTLSPWVIVLWKKKRVKTCCDVQQGWFLGKKSLFAVL